MRTWLITVAINLYTTEQHHNQYQPEATPGNTSARDVTREKDVAQYT
jgi:hypothetical protein